MPLVGAPHGYTSSERLAAASFLSFAVTPMIFTSIVEAKTSAPKTTVKKTTTATVAQTELFEHDLPPLQASVAQTFSGDFFLTMIGVAVTLALAARYIVKKAGIEI